MKVLVRGAGIFGATTAVELARAGVQVDLIERHADILLGASRANQGRLHAGYHYPRSLATAREVRDSAPEFAARFPTAIHALACHHYVVAGDSITGADKYLAFLDELGLPYRQTGNRLIRADTVEMAVRVGRESYVDISELRRVLRSDLIDGGVHLRFNTTDEPDGYDLTVDATYGHDGERPARYELCEIALIRLGPQFACQSFVVMDGQYMSLDPLVGTNMHMLYDVRHSVHHVSDRPDGFPAAYSDLIDRGLKYTSLTNVSKMEQTARSFLNGIGMPEYCGSLFTIRTVLPDVDDTDARPTIVTRDGDRISIFSGKIATAVTAARRVVELL